MARALVTGGAGFIGSHLVERLLAEGHDVVVLDDLSTGRLENLKTVLASPHVSFHQEDVADLKAIQPYFAGVEWAFHLAARADVVPSIQEPWAYHRANLDGTVAALEASRRAGVKRFLFAASSSCYGIPQGLPTPETAPIDPKYPYALTKYLAELCVFHWGTVYKLPVLSLRIFNAYGPRARTTGAYGAVFGVFLAQKLHGLPFTVVGDGTQKRDFVFVADVVEAFLLAARSDLTGMALNVGSGRPQSVNRIVELLGGGPVVHLPKRPGEPECTWADISRIRGLLGWEPKVSFEEGIGILLKGIEHWRDAPVWTPEGIAEATQEWFRYLGPG